ncbi:hypothetical protein DdX_21158 [Ditylenchus destructor]|uniref:Uncharacterized protein n=1 Tax=Ditylenchus destructor TaxID=166010 RepID=A0AAD4MF96_9BILA|nr:hypothetical protein DdX_21158 [Ditylenchus destructor]
MVRDRTVPDVAGVRPAVTIGSFSSEESEELRRFKKIAQMLNGRYHLVYIINTKAAPTVITIRPFEPLEKAIEYVRNFDQRSLLTHATHSPMPSLFDIGNGFTSEIFYSTKHIALLIFDSNLHSELQNESLPQAIMQSITRPGANYSLRLTCNDFSNPWSDE